VEGRVTVMTWFPRRARWPAVEQPLRVAEFGDLFATATLPAERIGPTELRIHLPAGNEVASKAQGLAAREAGCCSFFGFDVQASASGIVLSIRVPGSQAAVLDAMHERAEAARLRGARP
jgi:hypothetical protein